MRKWLSAVVKSSLERGLKLPHAHDPVTKLASFRLLCAYLSFVLAACSIVALHFKDVSIATWTAIGFWTLAMVFYMLKSLAKASVDLDDKSISLESADDEEKGAQG